MKTTARLILTIVLIATITGCATGPRPVSSLRNDGDWHFNRGEFDQAVTYYRQITNRYPGDWQTQYMYGQCELKLGNIFEARQALEIAHTRRPGHVGIVDALSEAMYLQGDENRLFAFLRERAESTQTAEAYLRLARYMMEMGDADSARTALVTAILIDEGQTVTPYLQAATFAERIGDIELAVIRLRQAYAIDPYDEVVKTRLRDMGEIPGPTLAMPQGIW